MKRGRPTLPKGESKSSSVVLRLQPGERNRLEHAAEAAGQNLSDWIRGILKVSLSAKVPEVKNVWLYSEKGVVMRVETPSNLSMVLWRRLAKYVEILEPKPGAGEGTG